jgi:hypothetical protein
METLGETALPSWLAESLSTWESQKDSAGFPDTKGFCAMAYILNPHPHGVTRQALRKMLGHIPAAPNKWWTPFFLPTGQEPVWKEGVLEGWVTCRTAPKLRNRAEFWRVSSRGEAFLLRALWEDLLRPMSHGTQFDVILPV